VLGWNRGGPSVKFDPTRVTQLSWSPRAFLYKGFLTDEECDHLIILAKDKLERSLVVDKDSGKAFVNEGRTSSSMFLEPAHDKIVVDIEARISAWTFLPVENGESIQVLRYENGEKYEKHFDFHLNKVRLSKGGHRVATVLMYLSNVTKGGETVFPNSDATLSQPKDDSWSECAHKGYAIKPQKGDALLFFSLHLDATTDNSSLHASCPVIEGEKWSATKWIHVRDYGKVLWSMEGGECVDENENCSRWAKRGECEKNPVYMVGGGGLRGICIKSCNVCSS